MIKQIYTMLIILILLTGCVSVTPKMGINNGQFMPCPDSPNCVSSMAEDEEHFIEPIVTTASSLEVQRNILKILNEFKSSKTVVIEDNYIRAEFTSKLFRFVDDVEFYFPDTTTDKIIIHVKSASRTGYSDLGVNRDRIEELRSMFD